MATLLGTGGTTIITSKSCRHYEKRRWVNAIHLGYETALLLCKRHKKWGYKWRYGWWRLACCQVAFCGKLPMCGLPESLVFYDFTFGLCLFIRAGYYFSTMYLASSADYFILKYSRKRT